MSVSLKDLEAKMANLGRVMANRSWPYADEAYNDACIAFNELEHELAPPAPKPAPKPAPAGHVPLKKL